MNPSRSFASVFVVALSVALSVSAASCAKREAACVQLSDAELAKLAASATSAPSAPPPAAASSSAVLYDLPKSSDFAPPPAEASSSRGLQPLAPMLAVEVSAAGSISCNGRPITLEALTALAQRTAEAEPQVRAVIRADGAATHRAVMEVLDHLKQGGVSRIAFAVVAAPAP